MTLYCLNKMCKLFHLDENIGYKFCLIRSHEQFFLIYTHTTHYFSSDLLKSKTETATAAWVKPFAFSFF